MLLCALLGSLLQAAAPAEPEFTLRSARFEGNLVVLTGVPSGPAAAAWRVWDADQELVVRSVGPPADPCVLVAVVDTSIESARIVEPVAKAIRTAAGDDPGLCVGVVAFSSTARCVLEPTADRDLLAGALAGLAASGRGSISSGVGLALGIAAAYPRARVVVIADGQDSLGPIPSSLTTAAAQAAGVPVFGVGVGNRVEMSLLTDLANLTGGAAVRVLTPVDVATEVRALVRHLAQEVEVRAAFPGGEPLRAHEFRVGTARPPTPSLTVVGPPPAGTGELVVPVERAAGAAEDTIAVLFRDGQPGCVVRSNRATCVPAGSWEVRVGAVPVAPGMDVTVPVGQRVAAPTTRLSEVEVRPPPTGLPASTAAWLTQGGEAFLEFAPGEPVPCRPGTCGLRVGTRPAYEGSAFEAKAGEVEHFTAPGVGELVVEALGPGGVALDCGVSVRASSGAVVLSGRSGHPEAVTEGLYQVAVAVPPARPQETRVVAGQRTAVRFADFGELLLRTVGPGGDELGLRYLVRAPDGSRGLVASGTAGVPLLLGAGVYDVTIYSAPELQCAGIAVTAGLRREDVIRRFGAVFVSGPETLSYRVFRASDSHWVGTFQAGRPTVLVEGDYRLVPDVPGSASGRAVRVDAGTVAVVDLAASPATGGT